VKLAAGEQRLLAVTSSLSLADNREHCAAEAGCSEPRVAAAFEGWSARYPDDAEAQQGAAFFGMCRFLDARVAFLGRGLYQMRQRGI